MFTGIITDIGIVRTVDEGRDTRIIVTTSYDVDEIDIGASVACSGPCLTVIEKGREGTSGWLCVQVSPATVARTTAGEWQPGRRLNLERALRMGDELGGHLVSGHVDGVATVIGVERVGGTGGSIRLTVRPPRQFVRFIAPKGSVTLDGVSLTVNDAVGTDFTVNLVPHTLHHTTFKGVETGTRLNFEVDLIARYVARLTEA